MVDKQSLIYQIISEISFWSTFQCFVIWIFCRCRLEPISNHQKSSKIIVFCWNYGCQLLFFCKILSKCWVVSRMWIATFFLLVINKYLVHRPDVILYYHLFSSPFVLCIDPPYCPKNSNFLKSIRQSCNDKYYTVALCMPKLAQNFFAHTLMINYYIVSKGTLCSPIRKWR